ncbi:MAG: DUF5752 family protein [Nitrospirota bacterium]
MSVRRAKSPFCFVSCMELREILGKRAMDEEQLLEIIEEAPADSIYYHTHSYYLRHPYSQGLFPNDFATWVALYAQDRALGERLGMIDPFVFNDIEQLREEILTIIGDHLSHIRTIPRSTTGEPFEFVRSHVIEADLGLEAWTLPEFRDALAHVAVGAVYNHACEARLRKGRLSGDFATWLSAEEGLGLPDLAAQVVKVGHLGLSLEGMRDRIVHLCDQAVSTA